MKLTLILCQLLTTVVPGQIDRACFPDGSCQYLAVQEGTARFIDPSPPARNLTLGPYLSSEQEAVPRTEAPIRVRSTSTWRVVLSAFLDHESGGTATRLRFFRIDGSQHGQYDGLFQLDNLVVGRLFGGNDEIAAVATVGEHSYDVKTALWLLPANGDPEQLAEVQGSLSRFVNGNGGSTPGVWINRETYDFEHAETKGHVPEFWEWDRTRKTLTLRKS